ADSSAHRILDRIPLPTGAAGTAPGGDNGGFVQFGPGASSIDNILRDSPPAPWKDSAGVHPATRTPTPVVQALANAARKLGAVDDQYVYMEVAVAGGYSLRRVPLAGGAETALVTNGRPFNDLSFDQQNFYFVENNAAPGATNRLRRM